MTAAPWWGSLCDSRSAAVHVRQLRSIISMLLQSLDAVERDMPLLL